MYGKLHGNKTLKTIIKTLIHLLPLLPLLFGKFVLAIAGLLALAICYIKVFKLDHMLEGSNDPELRRARDFWRSLTFLDEMSLMK